MNVIMVLFSVNFLVNNYENINQLLFVMDSLIFRLFNLHRLELLGNPWIGLISFKIISVIIILFVICYYYYLLLLIIIFAIIVICYLSFIITIIAITDLWAMIPIIYKIHNSHHLNNINLLLISIRLLIIHIQIHLIYYGSLNYFYDNHFILYTVLILKLNSIIVVIDLY